MPDHGHHAAQLHHLADGGGHDGGVVQLEGLDPRDVEGGRELPQDHVAQDVAAVVVVLVAVLHKGETIDVADAGAAVGTQQVEATDGLVEGEADLARDQLLLVGQDDGVADLSMCKEEDPSSPPCPRCSSPPCRRGRGTCGPRRGRSRGPPCTPWRTG